MAGVPFRSSIIRIDTNQASATYALMLKSRFAGVNPCNVDKIFRKIKQFGFHGRQGGGVSGVEMALMDLAGTAYRVPRVRADRGRFRDESRCYADTPSLPDRKQRIHDAEDECGHRPAVGRAGGTDRTAGVPAGT